MEHNNINALHQGYERSSPQRYFNNNDNAYFRDGGHGRSYHQEVSPRRRQQQQHHHLHSPNNNNDTRQHQLDPPYYGENDNNNNNLYHHHHHQHHEQQPRFVAEGAGDPSFFPHEQYDNSGINNYGQQWDHQDLRPQQWAHNQNPSATTAQKSPGSIFQSSEISSPLFGYPVSAIAFDDAYSALYVASTTQPISSTRWRNQRASFLVTYSTVDGMLYSSCAGHPEANPSVLSSIYECMFGISKTIALPPARQHIPPHAYRPPYGGSTVDSAIPLNTNNGGIKYGHLGINDLLPLSGYVASVSPSAVRIHTHGGLLIQDQDIEGMICGTIHPHSNQGIESHISVGGVSYGSKKHEVHCLDLWKGLRIVSSRAFKDCHSEKNVAVTCMGTSHDRGSIVAGCSDGNIRLLDGSLRELATVKSHTGGVSNISISDDGLLIATTGYGSRVSGKETSFLYTFIDPTVYVYDIRYLGRGGIPHPFAGLRGSPRLLKFLPNSLEGQRRNRLLVASGQPGGGLQVMLPLEAQEESSSSFIQSQLEQGESMSSLVRSEEDIAVGTSSGRIIQYSIAAGRTNKTKGNSTLNNNNNNNVSSGVFVPPRGDNSATSANSSGSVQRDKEALELPPFVPPLPPVSLEPSLLHNNNNDRNIRAGANEKVRSLFSTYTLCSEPTLTPIGNTLEAVASTFGSIANFPIVAPSRRKVAADLVHEASKNEGDFLVAIPTTKLGVDLMANHSKNSKKYTKKKPKDPIPNPNKLLYNAELSSRSYEDGLNRMRKSNGQRSRTVSGREVSSGEIPSRYKLTLRPSYKASTVFNHAEFNETGLFPGWDYPPTMPNAFAPPVLLLVYFIPEVRDAILASQFNERLMNSKAYEKALAPELGFLFHQIDSITKYSLLHPIIPFKEPSSPQLGAWVPSNFLSALSAMPEAEQLQIVDGSPAAVDSPRRPEAFYRFLAYHLDKEFSKTMDKKLMDSLQGVDFTSMNEFITGSGPPLLSSTRALTIDLTYDPFLRGFESSGGTNNINNSNVSFGEVLLHALCRETRLRAWNQQSKAYETIVQHKIVRSLPSILTLSCACAGRKEEEGLIIWRGDDERHWLPEFVEVELEPDGNVIVRELVSDNNMISSLSFSSSSADGSEESWKEYRRNLPPSVCKAFDQSAKPQKHRYRLDIVCSYVRDGGVTEGHHILHVRPQSQYKEAAIKHQQQEATKLAQPDRLTSKLGMSGSTTDSKILEERAESSSSRLSSLDDDNIDGNDWILFNGFVVSKTNVDDARAFGVRFKEPCLVIFRDVDPDPNEADQEVTTLQSNNNIMMDHDDIYQVPSHVMNARSIATSTNNTARPSKSLSLDGIAAGSLIAFDAEFVSVQEEEATLTESGSKLTLRETRHAVARISVIDCEKRQVILDDYVLPRERVVDYLTRFSGIVAQDLDPVKTTRNLITARNAYLKLRYLMELGCIFVGHGLRQDFLTVNLIVPPHQILDTVEIFHLKNMRFISLRFLANYVLGRDMQQRTHDSIEDALAAFEIYEKGVEWISDGSFQKRLKELYEYGQSSDWKVAGGGQVK